jgi:type IV/VI secretion system ImpK/VasF family protein
LVRETGSTMSANGPSDGGGNRTVFRPSPLSGARAGQPGALPGMPPPNSAPIGRGFPPEAAPGSAPSGLAFGPSTAPPVYGEAVRQPRLNDDDIPRPGLPPQTRSPIVTEASAVLAMAAAIRSGRARISIPEFHREATEAVAAYDRAIGPLYSDEVRQRARYALCATIDDIAQNLPNVGQDGTEWARRSLLVTFFRENIGGDRFWQLVDDLLRNPGANAELIELYHACLAAGFEGRFRVMPDGRTRLQQIMASLYAALDHPRVQSMTEISPRWQGADAPLVKVSMWNRVLLALAIAAGLLLLVYIGLQLVLRTAGTAPERAIERMMPTGELRLSRLGTPPPTPAASDQLSRLRSFLAPEIQQKLVVVEEDAATVRIRTTIGQLFTSGSDILEPGKAGLFERIGRAVESEPGQVMVEGHADSDRIAPTLTFPDNIALSRARAQTVANLIAGVLSNPGRIKVEGYGDAREIASNADDAGKALNRRVEITIPRQQR